MAHQSLRFLSPISSETIFRNYVMHATNIFFYFLKCVNNFEISTKHAQFSFEMLFLLKNGHSNSVDTIDLFKSDSENFGNHICMRSRGVFSTNHARAAHLRIL